MERAEIIEHLLTKGAKKDTASQYADAFLQYHEANDNIVANGHLVRDERTMKPMPNPYLSIRKDALATLRSMKSVKADDLW